MARSRASTNILIQPLRKGAFGAANNNTTGGVFGAPKPATGFGAFGGGGTSAFGGGGGAFGSTGNAPNTGVFGQPSTSTSAFGAPSNNALFGANKPAGFGSTLGTLSHVTFDVNLTFVKANPAPGDGIAPVTTGTANPPFSVYTEKDTANPSVTLQYQSITCMPAYRGSSFEVRVS